MKNRKNLNSRSIFDSLFAVLFVSIIISCSSGVINNKDGSVYNGRYSKGDNGEKIRSGKGLLTYPDGRKYDGIWAENNLTSGTFFDEKGEKVYQGEWQNEKFSGVGKLSPKVGKLSGYTLDGHFFNGKANGFGTLYKPDSTKEYEGYWKDFQYDGNGTFYLNGKKMYVGEFKNGITDGKGIVYGQNGQIEGEGEFKNWKLNGYGKRYKDGKLDYEGFLSDNLPNGKGTMYYDNGNKEYAGQFKKGKPNGQGISYKENGEKDYEGQFGNEPKPASYNQTSNRNIEDSGNSNSNSQDNSEKLYGYYQTVERYSMNPAEISGQNMFVMFNKNGVVLMAAGSSYQNAFSDTRSGISSGRIKKGSYNISGTTITIRWDAGGSANWTLSHVNGNITLGDDYQLNLVSY